jgi:hypothetical protein
MTESAAAAIKRRGDEQLAKLSETDLDALNRCLEIAKRDPQRADQLNSLLDEDVVYDNTWFEVARLLCRADRRTKAQAARRAAVYHG